MANKFKKDDLVIVISGSEKGKTGKIISFKGREKNMVVVEGVNLATIHKKPTNTNPGEIKRVEKAISISNISHVENGKPVKISFTTESGEGKAFLRKVRISKKTKKKIG